MGTNARILLWNRVRHCLDSTVSGPLFAQDLSGLLFGTVENSFRSDAITTKLPVILSIGGLWIPA
jgi:hypothetical protein